MKKILLSIFSLSCLIQLATAQNFYVDEDFNAAALPAGWTNTAVSGTTNWSFGPDGAAVHAGNQNLDGTAMAYFDDDALGGSSLNNTAELLTPVFDNSASLVTTLEFDYNARFFNGIPDSFKVDVFNGTSWVNVFNTALDDCGNYTAATCQNNFPHATIDISSFSNTNCQVRFYYTDGNDWGWYVGLDNVQIYSPFPNDLLISDILQPESGCGLGATDTVEVRIKNVGTNAASNFSVSYVLNGAAPVTENITATIAPNDSLDYRFTATANLSALGAYNLVTYNTLTGDGNAINDTLSTAFTNDPAFAPTYNSDFETASTGWVIGGTNTSWALGTPSPFLPTISAAASGAQAYVTNLTGTYNNNELSYVESPCFDFGASIGDPIMTFSLIYATEAGFDQSWMEFSIDNGVSWSKLPAGPNPTNWYNNTTAQVWEGISGGWLPVENILTGLAGQTQVKFRIVLSTDNSTLLEGIGFDNFSIRDPQAIDLSLNELSYPSSSSAPLCGYGSAENIIVEVENKGANPISSYDVSYQVDGGTIYTETINAVLPPNNRLSYTFSNQYNFSALRNYSMRVWVSTAGDGFSPNDTLNNLTVTNTQSITPGTIPYFEDFNAFPAPGLANGWTTNTAGDYNWRSNTGTTTSGSTGPQGDHAGNGQHGNNVYLYTEASFPAGAGDVALLESPCFDLSNNSGAKLIFWYHKYGGAMGDMFIDVYDGSQWVTGVDRINGETQTDETDPWLEREVTLNAFAGRRIKIRFRGNYGTSFTGDMAIDDVQLFEPLPKDANLIGPVAPVSGCDISQASTVEVEINNFGTLPILPDSMFVYYQVDDLTPVKDTFDQILNTEQTTVFTFTQPANFSVRGKKYNIKTWVELLGDPNQFNDTVFNYRVENQTRPPNFGENMETFRDAQCDAYLGQVVLNGWATEPGQYAWHVQNSRCGQGDNVTPQGGTGPNGDHTTAAGNGIFLYTAPTAATTGSTVASFVSPCIDLTNETEAAISFWYHKYGFQMGALSVQADTGTGWINLTTIPGQTNANAASPWLFETVSLTPFVGKLMQVRFRGTNGGARGNMAIDDILIYRPSTIDVGVTEITSPSGDNCNLPASAPVTVEVQNLGSQAIAPNTVELRYTNNGGQLTIDTLPQGIAVGATANFTFANNMDLSGGGEQIVRVVARLNGDTLSENNALETLVINRKVSLPFYFQNFERFELGSGGYPGDDLKSWSRFPNGTGFTWHAWQGNSPTMPGEPMPPPPIPPNGPSGDHTFATDRRNGDGIYMLTETKFRPNPPASSRPNAWLRMACNNIDLSTSANGRIVLSFWYHMFGANMGDLFVDVHNGTQWIQGVSVIRGNSAAGTMQRATDSWREWQVSLDNFSNVSNAQIRFRSAMTTPVGGGDIGIDDVSLLDRGLDDVTTKQLIEPESGCDMSNRESIEVQVQNTGIRDITQLNMGHQITHIGLDGVVTEFPVVHDSVVGALILPFARYTFEFTDRVDFSPSGRYEIKVWAENDSDVYAFNDTIFEVIENTTNPFPSCVDFSNLTYLDKGPDYQEQLLPNNWVSSQGASYAWEANIAGPEDTGGPINGNTSGVNDLYMLLTGGMPGQTAWIHSNCFDLTTTRAANLQFFYQATSPNHFMLVQIREVGGAWENLDTLQGLGLNSVNSWTKVELVLADFLGRFVEFRFFAVNPGGGFYAIDDICVVRPPNQQIELERIFRPRLGLCYYSDAETVTIRTQNVGNDQIDSFRVILAVDTNIQKFPLGQYQRDTFWIYPTNPLFDPGLKLDFDLDSTVDMSAYTRYYISALIFLPGDIDTMTNRIVNQEYVHGDPRDLPYIVDFEDPVNPLNGITVGPPTMLGYQWSLEQGLVQAGQGLTGPAFDHTLQNANGTYITTLSAGGAQGDAIFIQTECIDLQGTISPEMSYWYHMFSADGTMGDLFLQVDDDFGWETVDSVKGPDPDQIRNTSAWKEQKVDLSAYAGDVVKFRFISVRGTGTGSNMAIDDINIYDVAPSDAAAHSLERPNEKRWSCYTDTQTVKVGIRNNGSLPIDFNQDTLDIEVMIWRSGLKWDSLYKTVTTDVFRDPVTLLLGDLPKDSVAIIEMDGNFDMSDIDSTFWFETRINFRPDLITANDIRRDTVVARRETGTISPVILPDPTVCFGTPVQLTVENYFGALKWQEKTLDRNGNGFWFDGLSFPNDSPNYVTVLDTTSELRVEVCRQEVGIPISVNITKPYQGRALDNSRCGTGAIPLGLVTPANIDRVAIFTEDTASNPYLTLSNPTVLPSGEKQWDFVDVFKVRREGGETFDTTYTWYAETYIDSCVSPFRLPINASVNRIQSSTTFPGVNQVDSVCQDTAIVLNAGTQAGSRYRYDWFITYPNGRIDTILDTVQTFVIDGWRLPLDSTFTYSVIVTTDSGCVNTDNNGNPIPLTATITVVDSCVTSIEEYRFGDEFSIYPNPTNNDLFIEYRSLVDLNGRVSLLSMEGKLIEERLEVDFRRDRTKFNLGDLPKGIYFIRIETDEGRIVRKIVRS